MTSSRGLSASAQRVRVLMNDAEYAAAKERVMEVFERWRYPLGLNMWRLHMRFNRTDKPAGALARVAGTADPDWRYLEATVDWYLPVLADMDDEELEYVVLHELTHVLLNEMRESAGEGGLDHEERVVTQVATVLQSVRDHGRDGDLTRRAPAAQLREVDVYLGLEAA